MILSEEIMSETLKDRYGKIIANIKDEYGKQVIYDVYGKKLGYYDGRCTYDVYGRIIGYGNLLVLFIKDKISI